MAITTIISPPKQTKVRMSSASSEGETGLLLPPLIFNRQFGIHFILKIFNRNVLLGVGEGVSS